MQSCRIRGILRTLLVLSFSACVLCSTLVGQQSVEIPLKYEIAIKHLQKKEKRIEARFTISNVSDRPIIIDKKELLSIISWTRGSMPTKNAGLSSGEGYVIIGENFTAPGKKYEGEYVVLYPGKNHSFCKTFDLSSDVFFESSNRKYTLEVSYRFYRKGMEFEKIPVWVGTVDSNVVVFRF